MVNRGAAREELAQPIGHLVGGLDDQHRAFELLRRGGLVVRSPATGKLVLQDIESLTGRYVAKGESVAMVWNPDAAIVRALVPLWQIDLVRDRTQSVTMRPAYDPTLAVSGAIVRVAPSASELLPNQVLSIEGGGPFATIRERDNSYRMQEAMFQVDIRMNEP